MTYGLSESPINVTYNEMLETIQPAITTACVPIVVVNNYTDHHYQIIMTTF